MERPEGNAAAIIRQHTHETVGWSDGQSFSFSAAHQVMITQCRRRRHFTTHRREVGITDVQRQTGRRTARTAPRLKYGGNVGRLYYEAPSYARVGGGGQRHASPANAKRSSHAGNTEEH